MDENNVIDLAQEVREASVRLGKMSDILQCERFTVDVSLVVVSLTEALKLISDKGLEAEFCEQFTRTLMKAREDLN